MDDERDCISAWISREIVPHERAIQRWLSRRWSHVVDIEDVIQEAYCRIASLATVDHIDNPASYFFRTAQSVVTDMMRRAGIFNFASPVQTDCSNVMDSEPLADRAMEAGQELERVHELLAELPHSYRRVIELRRIEGLSRKETAERLGVSENEVKNYLVRGLRRVMQSIADQDMRADGDLDEAIEQKVGMIGKHRPH